MSTEPNRDADARVVWVTGAGSGIGQAAAIAAADAGWRVALSGRRVEALDETAHAIRDRSGEAMVVPLDVNDSAAVVAAAAAVASRWGRIDGLVIAAGLNAPERRWDDQSMETFDRIIQTNLIAPAHVISAALPQLRVRGGAVVVVSSYAAWTFSPNAGVAYSASKSGLSALTRTLNAQEAGSRIRATHLCPGDVDSDFLDLRPRVPDASARSAMLSPAEVARSIQFILNAPEHLRFDELVVSPLSQI
ncbi:SDR family oxidoreductase [Leifsonia poae]|uniref:SDR family oxidoreductase n=1 Tax=Leifsonia poae TaxID=110933 RepID=UPI003D666C06